MRPIRLDAIRKVFPRLDELRPLLDLLLEQSEPDPSSTWSGSGVLRTAGDRLVGVGTLEGSVGAAAAREAEHIGAVYNLLGGALQSLAQGDDRAAGKALLRVGSLEEDRDRPGRAAAYAESAHGLFAGVGDGRLRALALRRWARALWSEGRLEEALGRYREAVTLARGDEDHRGAAEAAIGAGNVLEEQGRWPGAAEWYHRALSELDALEASGSVDAALPYRWQALLNLHIVTRSGGDLTGSRAWLERSEIAAKADPSSAPFLLNARGQLLMGEGQFEEAVGRFIEALGSAAGPRAAVTIRLNLAEALLALGRTLESAEAAREAERQAVRAGLVRKLPEVYRLLGRVATDEANPEAFVLFERALDLVSESGLPAIEEALTLQAYAESLAKGGDPEGAAQLRERAKEAFASIGILDMRHPWMDAFGKGKRDHE